MPDLTIEYYYLCSSAVRAAYNIEGSEDKTYQVEYDHNYINTKSQGWSCDCQGYKFRKTCNHIKKAQEKHCGWLQFANGDEPVDGKCPKCGDDISSRGWGV